MAGQATVAVLGAGSTMGFPMARNLARAGMSVRAWNRSADKAEPLAGDGVTVAGSAAQAVGGADVVLTMLADADAVLSVMDGQAGASGAARANGAEGEGGALAAMSGPAVWLQMSTIGEAGTARCAALADRRGVAFVDAPVLGSKLPAEQGTLVVLASGPDEVRDQVQPVLDVVGARTLWLGPAGAGTRLKLVANCWVLAVVEAGAETLALAEGLGLRPEQLFEAIDGGPLDLPYLRTKGMAMIERRFEPMFSLRLAAKDARLAAEAAASAGLDLPLLPVIRDRLARGAQRYGDEDFSATYLTSSPDSA